MSLFQSDELVALDDLYRRARSVASTNELKPIFADGERIAECPAEIDLVARIPRAQTAKKETTCSDGP